MRRLVRVLVILSFFAAIFGLAAVRYQVVLLSVGEYALAQAERTLKLRDPIEPSPELATAIATATGGSVPLTDRDYEKLTTLANLYQTIPWEMEVEKLGLGALERCTSLKTLDISDLTTSNAALKSLKHMPQLEEFACQWSHSGCGNCDAYWENGELSDITPLRGLIQLKRVNINGQSVVDVHPLAGLINLEDLDLSYNPVTDLSPLKGLPHLKRLCLGSTKVEDLTVLADLPALEEVEMWGAPATDLTPLLQAPRLVKLYVDEYQRPKEFTVQLTKLKGQGVRVNEY